MSAKTPRKKVDQSHWEGRLKAAIAFHEAAEQALDLAELGQNANPVISQMVLAAIAYADALTAKRAFVVNQQDHGMAPRLLRDVLGKSLPDTQEKRFKRLLAPKDEVQYGARMARTDEARRLLVELREFAAWAGNAIKDS